MNQKFIKLSSLVLVAQLATFNMPVMANAKPQPESQHDTKIVKFVEAVGFPKSVKAIKTGSTYIADVWNYPHAVNGKDMYILFENGHPKAVTIDGKVVLSALDG